jgi:hypothetical protein
LTLFKIYIKINELQIYGNQCKDDKTYANDFEDLQEH